MYFALQEIALKFDFLKQTPDKLTITLLVAAATCKYCTREATEGNLCFFCDEAMNEARMEAQSEKKESIEDYDFADYAEAADAALDGVKK